MSELVQIRIHDKDGNVLFDWPAVIVNDETGRRVDLQDLTRWGMVQAGEEVTYTTENGFWSYYAEPIDH